MSVKTRVGMVAALSAAASLVLVVALAQAASEESRLSAEQTLSESELTYVPLEGIPVDDPLSGDTSPATEDAGGAIEPDEPERSADPDTVPWSAPRPWLPPHTDPYLGRPDGTTERPPTPSKEKPRERGTAAGAPTAKPDAKPDSTTDPGSATAAPTEAPLDGTVGTGEDGTTATGPVDETPGTDGAEPVPTPPLAPDTGAVGGGGATGDGGAIEPPPVELPPTDVIDAIEPPPVELLPPPEITPEPTPTPTAVPAP